MSTLKTDIALSSKLETVDRANNHVNWYYKLHNDFH